MMGKGNRDEALQCRFQYDSGKPLQDSLSSLHLRILLASVLAIRAAFIYQPRLSSTARLDTANGATSAIGTRVYRWAGETVDECVAYPREILRPQRRCRPVLNRRLCSQAIHDL